MRPAAEWVNALRTSFWVAPAAMGVGAAVLALVAIAFDHIRVPWPNGGSGEGAQLLLSTLAGSIITVTGVVFSLTLVTLHLASNQFGPHLLRSFMRDRTNQVVLGTFIATFVYCVIALVEEPRAGGPAVALALLLTAASVAVLIYFIHHLAVAIQADSVVSKIASQLGHQIDAMYPPEPPDAAPRPETRPQVLAAKQDGYLLSLDKERLLAQAKRHRATIEVVTRPGQFVTAGSPVLHVWPAAPEGTVSHVAVGPRRTENEDIEFSIQQLAEMAVRALSPSVNEPFTALVCINQLSAAYSRLATRDASPRVHRDGDGLLIVPRASFEDMLDAGFGVIRQHTDSSLTKHGLLIALGRVAKHCDAPRAQAVRQHAEALMERTEQHAAFDVHRLQKALEDVAGP